MNHDHLVFVVDKELPEKLIPAIQTALRDAREIYRVRAWFADLEKDYGVKASDFIDSAEIVKETKEYGKQRDAKQILTSAGKKLLVGEGHQIKGRHIVFITASDITSANDERVTGYLNFCFDLYTEGNAIVSMARFKNEGEKTQETVLTGLIMQSIGYIFGIASDPYCTSTEDNLGMHCTNKYCVMHQGLTKEKMAGVMRRAAMASILPWRSKPYGKYYCRLCAKDIKSVLLT